jgi:hypothetical protein
MPLTKLEAALDAGKDWSPHLLTRRQHELWRILRGGGRLQSDIGGWRTMGGRKLREETRRALELSRKLVEISVKGKYIHYHLIVHQKNVNKWCDQIRKEGKRVMRIQPRDDD